jgi:hypothetical protein
LYFLSVAEITLEALRNLAVLFFQPVPLTAPAAPFDLRP